MDKIQNLINGLRKIKKINQTLQKIFKDPFVQDYIIALNQEQLQAGEDNTGTPIRTFKAVSPDVYSAFTMNIKAAKGQPVDKVTLFDEGDFYKSFDVKALPTAFEVTGEEAKDDGEISDNVDMENIYNLNTENVRKLLDQRVIPAMQEINKEILGL